MNAVADTPEGLLGSIGEASIRLIESNADTALETGGDLFNSAQAIINTVADRLADTSKEFDRLTLCRLSGSLRGAEELISIARQLTDQGHHVVESEEWRSK